jgi:hypothetical protein
MKNLNKNSIVKKVLVNSIWVFAMIMIVGSNYKASMSSEKRIDAPDILIIFSSGTPFKTISQIKPSDLDSISMATPKEINCRIIAEKLAKILSVKCSIVKVVEANEINGLGLILQARMIVIGSPGYFSNVSWEIKRVLDREFGRIYVMAQEEIIKLRVAAYGMAEGEYSAKGAIKAIEAAVKDCKGDFGPTEIFVTNEKEKLIEERIMRFAEKIQKTAQVERESGFKR